MSCLASSPVKEDGKRTRTPEAASSSLAAPQSSAFASVDDAPMPGSSSDSGAAAAAEWEGLESPCAIRWAPTSELELYHAEAAILKPIRPLLSQRAVAGLNTICTLHEKRRGDQVVNMHRAIPNKQERTVAPLDADNYTSIILVHGFAGGVGNWLPIWGELAQHHDVYAIDLPGFARSVRPPHSAHAALVASADSALQWYMDCFKAWFDEMRLGEEEGAGDAHAVDGSSSQSFQKQKQRPRGRRVVLVGHSFGGYLSAMFATRYPHLADHLVLADTWGLPRYVKPCKETDPEGYAFRKSMKVRFALWVFDSLGTSGCLRLMGPMGPGVIRKLRPDFGDSWKAFLEDPNDFYNYTYHCNANPNRIGERAFQAVGATPIAAKHALVDHVTAFGHGRLAGVTVLYGSKSWMFSLAVGGFVKDLADVAGIQSRLVIIPDAGDERQSFRGRQDDSQRRSGEAIGNQW